MNCAIGCTICVARGRIPTHTPIGTQIRLASAIRTNTRSIVSVARAADLQGFAQRRVLDEHQDDMPEPEHDSRDDQRDPQHIERSFGSADVGAGGSSSLRLTARLVNMTAEWKNTVAA